MKTFFGVCNLSAIPLRAEPSHKAEMISQILFADSFEVFEEEKDWLHIKMDTDGYVGWVDGNQVLLSDAAPTNQSDAPFLTSAVSTMLLRGQSKTPIYLHAGSTLPFYDGGKCKLGNDVYQVTSSNVFLPNVGDFDTNIQETAKIFLNSPYVWGGRTPAGIDCSGFSQMAFKMSGIQLNRDAWQQAEQGCVVDFLSEAKAGDLAFFDNDEGRITHVGIMLNNSQIIHASGKVKIDRIDNQGIYAVEQKKYTHSLRIIKRYTS